MIGYPEAPRAWWLTRGMARISGVNLPRAVVVGHSLGCLFAARFALRHPGRVAALVLLSPALGYAVPPGAALPDAVQARIEDLAALGPAAFAETRAPRLVARAEALPGVRRAMAAVNPAGYAQAVHALAAGDLLADAALLDLPVLVGVGDADVVTPPANAQLNGLDTRQFNITFTSYNSFNGTFFNRGATCATSGTK